MTPKVTIAVVSWNTRDLLDDCLASMKPDADAGLIEVWVHDNASDDGSPALVEERYPWVKLIKCEDNLGFGPAVNRVAAQSDAEWIAPANADIRVTPGAIAAMLAAGEADPGAGMIAPRLILPDESIQPSLGAFQTLSRATIGFLQLGRVSRRMRIRVDPYLDQETARRIEWAAGAFLLVRREAYEAVGGFQESQWMYAEDLDLGWRLKRAGWASRYEPGASVRHEHGAAAEKAFGSDGANRRQHAATWAWSVQRLGRVRTAAIALLELIEGCLRAAVAGLVRKSGEHGRRQIAFAQVGLRHVFRGPQQRS